MIKNNNHSEGLTYVKGKVDMKLKCKQMIIHSLPPTHEHSQSLAVIYSFETVISTEHVIIKQEFQVTQ